jgi:hypothetical protein
LFLSNSFSPPCLSPLHSFFIFGSFSLSCFFLRVSFYLSRSFLFLFLVSFSHPLCLYLCLFPVCWSLLFFPLSPLHSDSLGFVFLSLRLEAGVM